MTHITHILIENFQSHARSELHLTPGLNVIVGPSDNGKSAVLRALKWCLYSEPRGADFVRHGAKECRVTVTISDGATICRELLLGAKGAARHRYVLTLPGAEPQVFEGFGVTVPEEVLKAHGMPYVKLAADREMLLNLGTQLEGPFLLSEKASFRSQAIGRLLGVHVIDTATRDTQRDMAAAKKEATRLDGEVARLTTALEPFGNLADQEAALTLAGQHLDAARTLQDRLGAVEALGGSLRTADTDIVSLCQRRARLDGIEAASTHALSAELAAARLTRLTQIQGDLAAVEGALNQAEAALVRLDGVCDALALAGTAALKQARYHQLHDLHRQLSLLGVDLTRLQGQAARLAHVPVAAERSSAITEAGTRLQVLRTLKASLATLTTDLATAETQLQQAEATRQKSLTEYGNLLRTLGRCPTCGQDVGPDTIHHVLSELTGAA